MTVEAEVLVRLAGRKAAGAEWRPFPFLDQSLEIVMPEVHVFALEGRTPEQKKALMKEITDAVVKNFSAKPEAVTVQIFETPKTDKAKAGIPFTER